MTIHLWNSDNYGLIVLDPAGPEWSNQAGGTACAHPTALGFYVPLHDFLPRPAAEVLENFYGSYDADTVDNFLNQCDDGLGAWLCSVRAPDCDSLDLMEAWVPVKIVDVKPKLDQAGLDSQLADLLGRRAILVYPNSD